MFHRSNSPAITLAMLIAVAAIPKPLATTAYPISPLAQPTEAVRSSRNLSIAPTQLVAGISSPLDSNQPIAPETQSTFTDQSDQFHESEQPENTQPENTQPENTWTWYLISLIVLSLLVGQVKGYRVGLALFMRQIQKYAVAKSPIANKAIPPASSDLLVRVLRRTSIPFINNTRSISQSFSNAGPTNSSTPLQPDAIAAVPLAPATQKVADATNANNATDKQPVDITPDTRTTALPTDAALLDNASIHYTQQLEEECKIVIQPLLAAASVNRGLPQPETAQSQAVVRWMIPTDRKLALQQQGGQTLVLRVYDATGINLDQQPAHSFRQYYCEESAVDRIIPILNIDRDYVAEIGYLTQDGRLLRLAQSAQ